ncbi:MAG: phospholipase [Muribaculaceae bacterium]
MKRLISLITAAMLLLPALAEVNITAHRGEVSDGYNFWLYKPAGVSDTDTVARPLVIFLHGASLCGSNLDRVKRYGTIDALVMGRTIDAYVIAPQNPGGAWSPRRIMNIVDHLSGKMRIDSTRVYALGMSLGGYGTIDLAATYPDRIAAAIGICGGASVKDLSGLTRLPLWIIHGTADRAVPVKQSDNVVQTVNALRADSDSVRLVYDRVPGMNHSRPARLFYIDDIYDWLLSHSLNDPDRLIKPTIPITDQLLNGAYQGLNVPARRSHRRSRRR